MNDASPRLLVLRLSALGDVIHTIPAVAMLRDALPGTRIQWVVEAPYRELVEVVAGVEPIPVRLKAWSRALLASRRDMRRAAAAMRGAGIAVDFQGLIKSAALAGLSRAPRRYGFDANAIREKAALLFLNERVAVDTSKHVIEQNVELARALAPNAPSGVEHWERYPQPVEGDLKGAVVLLPGAGKANKLWPIERFRAVAEHVGERALAVWGPGERSMAEAIGARVAPPTTVRELAYVLRHAALVIGGDTGPLHLAAALGTPVIGLYGPTNPRRNGPYGQLDRCVNHFDGVKTMESITTDEVLEKIEETRLL